MAPSLSLSACPSASCCPLASPPPAGAVGVGVGLDGVGEAVAEDGAAWSVEVGAAAAAEEVASREGVASVAADVGLLIGAGKAVSGLSPQAAISSRKRRATARRRAIAFVRGTFATLTPANATMATLTAALNFQQPAGDCDGADVNAGGGPAPSSARGPPDRRANPSTSSASVSASTVATGPAEAPGRRFSILSSLVGDTGFEPATSAMSTQRSNHLS